MKTWETKIAKLNNLYDSSLLSSLIFLKGEMGLGQTHTITGFVKNKKNVIRVRQLFENDYFLNPFIDALSITKQEIENSQHLSEPDKLRFEIINILKTERKILIFESITSFNEQLFHFCDGLIRYVLEELKETNTFIIVEIDTDVLPINEKVSHMLKDLLTISFEAQFINYSKLNQEDLQQIFFEGFHSNININDIDLEYIIESSFGNVSWLMLIVNYLKQEEYIYFSEDNNWQCLHIPEGALDDIIKKNIYKRYDKLDSNLKTILQKSSLIGPVFHTEQLRQSFELLKIHQELMQIEKISQLIYNSQNDTKFSEYTFESKDTHKIIHEIVPDDKRCSWNDILAQYFEKISADIEKSNIEKFQIYRKTANCNMEARKYKKAIIYYLKAIHLSIRLLDYAQALILIHKAKSLLCFLDNIDEYVYVLLYSEAKCYQALGQYTEELAVYDSILERCKLTEQEFNKILFHKASALYSNAQNRSALELLHKIEEKLPFLSNDRLSLDVFRELAAIYFFCRQCNKAGQYFTQALNVCQKGKFERDYYILLRQSSMFWDLEISKKAQLKALQYFDSEKDIKEQAMVCHNLGTDALWLGDSEFANTYLTKAKALFSKFGTSDIHYTYNCLGVYKAVYENNFELAITFFEKIRSFKTDLFSQLISIINSTSCYCSLQNFKEAGNLIEKYEKLLNEMKDPIPPYFLYYYITKGIYYKLQNKVKESISNFKKSLEYELKNEQLFLVGMHLKDLQIAELKLDGNSSTIIKIDSLCAIQHKPFYDKLYAANLCLSTLRFWW